MTCGPGPGCGFRCREWDGFGPEERGPCSDLKVGEIRLRGEESEPAVRAD